MTTLKPITTALSLIALMITTSPAKAGGCVDTAAPNTFGVYFDLGEGALCNEIWTGGDQDAMTAYLILAGPAAAAISGWEAGVTIRESPQLFVLADIIAAGGINAASAAGEYIVGYSTPQPTTGITTLVTWSIMYLGNGAPLPIYGKGVGGFACLPTYTDADTGQEVQCEWATCSSGHQCVDPDCRTTLPVAVINGDPPVSVERTSWSSIKALHR